MKYQSEFVRKILKIIWDYDSAYEERQEQHWAIYKREGEYAKYTHEYCNQLLEKIRHIDAMEFDQLKTDLRNAMNQELKRINVLKNKILLSPNNEVLSMIQNTGDLLDANDFQMLANQYKDNFLIQRALLKAALAHKPKPIYFDSFPGYDLMSYTVKHEITNLISSVIASSGSLSLLFALWESTVAERMDSILAKTAVKSTDIPLLEESSLPGSYDPKELT